MTTTELVNVAVPREYLSRVYGLIAELDAVRGTMPAENGLAQIPESLQRRIELWTPMRIQRMVMESEPPMLALLKKLAERAGEWLTIKELAAAVGREADWKTVAGMLGAFGHRMSSRYGLDKAPFERRHDRQVRGKVYRMPKAVGEEVLRCLNV